MEKKVAEDRLEVQERGRGEALKERVQTRKETKKRTTWKDKERG